VLRKLVSSVPGLHGRESHLSNQVAILGAINSVAKGDNGDVSVHSLWGGVSWTPYSSAAAARHIDLLTSPSEEQGG